MTSANGGANTGKDEFGAFFHKRRFLGTVPLESDGSARFIIPGGLPILYKLPDTPESAGKLPRVQREAIFFSPGEYAHQSFRREFFNGLCGGCHGTVSGRSVDFAIRPEILTQASTTLAKDRPATDLNLGPGQRGGTEGP
jgi:hypothetical protein